MVYKVLEQGRKQSIETLKVRQEIFKYLHQNVF